MVGIVWDLCILLKCRKAWFVPQDGWGALMYLDIVKIVYSRFSEFVRIML